MKTFSKKIYLQGFIKQIQIQKTKALIVRFQAIVLFLICFICATLPVSAQNVYVKAELDTNSILIGDQVRLRLQADFPQGVTVLMPAVKDTFSSNIEIVSLLSTDSVKAGDNFRYIRTYVITSFDSGQFFVPALPFIVTFPDGRKDTLQSYPVELNVSNQLNDTTQVPYDIKEPLSVPISFREIAQWTGIGLLIAIVIAAIVYFFLMKKKNKPIFKFEKPKDSPHVVAFRDLDALKAQKLWQQGNVKEYYSRLTDIIRLYIEDRYFVPALESTTDEIADALFRLNLLDQELLKSLITMLQGSDLVKFAKMLPMPDENDQAWDFAYNFIDITKFDRDSDTDNIVNQNKSEGGGL